MGGGIIQMIVVGLIVGLLARAIMPGDQKLGLILTTLLGIAGSAVANFIGSAVGWYRRLDRVHRWRADRAVRLRDDRRQAQLTRGRLTGRHPGMPAAPYGRCFSFSPLIRSPTFNPFALNQPCSISRARRTGRSGQWLDSS